MNDLSKMTLKEAAKFGFVVGLASPALLFSPINLSSPDKTVKTASDGLAQDELKVISDYARANPSK